MERVMRANAIIKLSCLLFAASAVAAEIGYTNKAAGISLRLPEGWIVAEGKAAEEMAGLQARLEPVIRPRETLASFLKSDSGLISGAFPKIIVQWQRDAEVGIKQFQNIH